jgi:hypothetical protein
VPPSPLEIIPLPRDPFWLTELQVIGHRILEAYFAYSPPGVVHAIKEKQLFGYRP